MLSDLITIEEFFGGRSEESTWKTAFASSKLMCSSCFGSGQTPYTDLYLLIILINYRCISWAVYFIMIYYNYYIIFFSLLVNSIA